MLESKAYKTYYAYAFGEKTPKPKYVRKKADSDTSPKKRPAPATKGTRLKSSAKMAKSDKKKQHAKMPKKGLAALAEVALTEAKQLKLATKRSKTQFHSSHLGGSGNEVDTQSKVPDEQQQKNLRHLVKMRKMLMKTDVNDDSEETESDNDGDDLTHPNMLSYKVDNEEEEEEEEKIDDKEMSSNQRVSTPPEYELTKEEENKEGDDEDIEGEQEQDKEDDLYRDVNINLERNDAEMTNAQANQDIEDTHVTLTTVPLVVQQQSYSISSDLVSKFINPSSDTGSTTTTIPTMTLPDIPNFASLFQFGQRVSALETKMSEFKQTNQFAEDVPLVLGIVDNYLASKMKEVVDMAVQAQVSKFMLKIKKYVTESLGAKVLILIDKIEENKSINRSDIQKNLYNALVESYNSDKDIITSYGNVVTLKKGREDQDKDEDPSAGSNRGSKRRRSGKEAESSKESTDKESKSTSSSKGNDDSQWNPSSSLNHDREWHKTETVDNQPPQPRIIQMAHAAGTQSLFNEFLATPIDFSFFILQRLKIDNMTQEVLTSPSYDLIKGVCISVVKLEYHLEEVFKATNDRLDWHNPERKPYPHDLNKPLPLIQNERGRQAKAVDYGQVNWIEDEVSRIWSPDDKLYKFREGDFKRLCKIDIEDMLLLLVQDKLSNLNLEERYALNVALRMLTRRIVIQKHVEDLQLGVESYQKKINLKRPDTYRSDLRRMTPYTTYLDIQGIVYEDEMNKNHLMRTDKLHKSSDGTLNHVRTTLNDIATGIEIDYLPKRK
nr:hypothetical protein [Tanacetum cinerariifolium]